MVQVGFYSRPFPLTSQHIKVAFIAPASPPNLLKGDFNTLQGLNTKTTRDQTSP
ncbi:MAG: hypothetical protein JWO03_1027 [Bacteroidetes bacterium]|nr:hypothetical protein [Bacteroidota bacterium]